MLLAILIFLIIANCLVAAFLILTATEEPGFKRKLLLGISAVPILSAIAFLTIYATTYGPTH